MQVLYHTFQFFQPKPHVFSIIIAITYINFLLGAGTSYNEIEGKIHFPLMGDLLKYIKEDEAADISTLLAEIKDEDLDDPNMVKCVKDINGYAMYFSRSKIPYERNIGVAKFYKHIGIYGYKRESLFKMTKFEQPEVELAESLEQLRALYNGMKIKTSVVEYQSIGIDTIEDFNAFKKRMEQ